MYISQILNDESTIIFKKLLNLNTLRNQLTFRFCDCGHQWLLISDKNSVKDQRSESLS